MARWIWVAVRSRTVSRRCDARFTADSDGVGAAEMNSIQVYGSWIKVSSADRQQVEGGFDRGFGFSTLQLEVGMGQARPNFIGTGPDPGSKEKGQAGPGITFSNIGTRGRFKPGP